MRSLRSRYILSHVLPLLVTAPLVTLALLYLLEAQVFLQDLSDDLSHQAALIAQATSASAELWDDPALAQGYLAVISDAIIGDIALYDASGALLATTAEDGSELVMLNDLPSLVAGEIDINVSYQILGSTADILQPVFDLNQELTGIVRVTEELQAASSAVAQLRQFLFVALLVELLVGSIIGVFMAHRMVGRIRNVTATVDDIAHGDPVDDLSAEGAREIQQLYASVNHLAHELNRSENARRRLLANLVHELGRPLGALRAAVDALRSGATADPVLRDELLLGMEQHLEQMDPLLDDLAHMHGQIVGQRALDRRLTAISDWLPPLLLPLRAQAVEKEIAWSTDVDPALPALSIDPDRLGQAVGNLVSNAIKYTPPGGSIAVTATQAEGTVQIAVTDTGSGIGAEEQARIFEPFYRSRAQRRFPQGLGLGLSIARDLVTAHGGQLQLESEPGVGSTFTIVLPIDSSGAPSLSQPDARSATSPGHSAG